MLNKPGIVTAIPRRRYSLGEYTVVVLHEIESNDGIDYSYIMAVVRGQDPEPGLYITAERIPGRDIAMRIVMQGGDEVLGTSPAWSDLEAFVTASLDIVARVLNVTDETPYQLM
ncbi:MAG: hypothetical protein WBO06_10750 [Gammaproteobacteria bacterium]